MAFTRYNSWRDGLTTGVRRRIDYPNPFQDIASLYMPDSLEETFDLAEHIADRHGDYREALRRLIAFCVTKPEIISNSEGVVINDDVREKYLQALQVAEVGFPSMMHAIMLDRIVYGNSFISVQVNFTRYLHCRSKDTEGKRCSCELPLRAMMRGDYNFHFQNFEFCGRCPVCGKTGAWDYEDRYSTDPNDLFIKRWNPHEIALLNDKYTGRSKVIWRIPPDYRDDVRKGKPHVLEAVPAAVITAIKENGDIQFDDDFIHHGKEAPLAGVETKGWGIPQLLRLFRQIWFSQITRSYNEALATDYIIPRRVISPPSGNGTPGQDPLQSMNGNQFVFQMRSMMNKMRRDPGAWMVSPFALQYQTLGGDASTFLPREMLEYADNALLTGMGMPVELYKGTLSVQAAPTALRLLISFCSDHIDRNNQALNFVVKRIGILLGWEQVQATFKDITLAEDMTRIQNVLNLGMNGEISKTTALEAIGISKRDEDRRIMDEQRDLTLLQQQQQEEMEENAQLKQMYPGGVLNAVMQQQQAQNPEQGGGAPQGAAPGGMPVPAGGNGLSPLLPGADPISQMLAQAGQMPGDTIEDLWAKAQTIAQQIMGMPNRASALRKLESSDKQMHALVKSIIEDIESNAASEGKQMVMQQQFGGGQ